MVHKVIVKAEVTIPDTFGYSPTYDDILIRVLDKSGKAHAFPVNITSVESNTIVVQEPSAVEEEE